MEVSQFNQAAIIITLQLTESIFNIRQRVMIPSR
jgi:hypothetical protein